MCILETTLVIKSHKCQHLDSTRNTGNITKGIEELGVPLILQVNKLQRCVWNGKPDACVWSFRGKIKLFMADLHTHVFKTQYVCFHTQKSFMWKLFRVKVWRRLTVSSPNHLPSSPDHSDNLHLTSTQSSKSGMAMSWVPVDGIIDSSIPRMSGNHPCDSQTWLLNAPAQCGTCRDAGADRVF